jgi:hypothetical protein
MCLTEYRVWFFHKNSDRYKHIVLSKFLEDALKKTHARFLTMSCKLGRSLRLWQTVLKSFKLTRQEFFYVCNLKAIVIIRWYKLQSTQHTNKVQVWNSFYLEKHLALLFSRIGCCYEYLKILNHRLQGGCWC